MEVITCRCGAEWTGLGRCHCSKCHTTFGGLTSFDKHRKNEICLHPEELELIEKNNVWVGTYSE